MHIQINHASDRSVYQQIIDHIKKEIALGRLRVDDRLPTVRQLAADLVINPNTIAKAYRQLEQDNIITTRAGAGAFVAPIQSPLSLEVRENYICHELERVTVDAIHMQIGKSQFRQWFDRIVDLFQFGPVAGVSHE